MIDKYDVEAIVKNYRLLNKRCMAIDRYIANCSVFHVGNYDEYGAEEVVNNITDLMCRKNKIINLKLIIDKLLTQLDVKYKQVIIFKMNYNITMQELSSILESKTRTIFRRVERAYEALAKLINESKYAGKIESILMDEDWLGSYKIRLKDSKKSYNCMSV